MNRFFSPKFLVAATLATVALGAASVAEARPEVSFSIGFQNGPAWVEPAPVYFQPRPVFVEPAPVYVRPPVFVAPHEVFERARWGGYESRFEREREWRRAEWLRHQRQERFGDRDHDRDHDRDGRMQHHDQRR